MPSIDDTLAALGNEPPLVVGGREKPPDRREVSIRWLSGTFLTAVTSSVLMGVALFAALDGREVLATPPEILSTSALGRTADSQAGAKGGRLVPTRNLASLADRRRMELATMRRSGDRDVLRTLPFVQARMSLAAGHATNRSYPSFDGLEIFAEEGAPQYASTTGIIYGAGVENVVRLRMSEFPLEMGAFDEGSALSAEEVEVVVRSLGAILTVGEVRVAALHYVDPQRFGDPPASSALQPSSGIRIVAENASVANRARADDPVTDYAEDVIPFHAEGEIAEALERAGYASPDAEGMATALTTVLGSSTLAAGSILRLGVETRRGVSRIVRASLYDVDRHVSTVALNDRRQYVPASEPEHSPAVQAAFDSTHPPAMYSRDDLPTLYDGIYRAAFSHGLSRSMTRQLVRLLAADVDLQSRLNQADSIEVFFSQPDGDDNATPESELLFVRANVGGTARAFYRFQMQDGTVGYFDENGRSARPFLLRNPIPNGEFRSGFGNRRHPILGYTRAHTGIDWAAPRGTPIIASGDGVVEQAGWNGGYGRQTVINHANGYQTTFNHQSKIADGVVPGARIRQGQIIGYVGSTGLSTGNHLHYELIVNGTKVDPMRVRLPAERTLAGDELQAFLAERDRIDGVLLMEQARSAPALHAPV
ncbi:M23 family metallopeptidase [Neoaquamicrobium sediminum]|uniref:M23 family metallopeptidase n=1 Tax=Neoaquamicrobium sediminum TaxID=1849104 RepID=A0ABV3WYU0_9HYPH